MLFRHWDSWHFLSSFTQLDAPIVPIHANRDDDTETEIYSHRHRDDLDRLSGLVHRRSGKYIDKVGIADGHGKRGILRQV